MKKKNIVKTVYETSDGKRFESLDVAELHSMTLDLAYRIKSMFIKEGVIDYLSFEHNDIFTFMAENPEKIVDTLKSDPTL